MLAFLARFCVASIVCFGLQIPQAAKADSTLRPGGSVNVLYAFPTSSTDVSVGQTGENTFSLRIPTFPAYLKPSISASYSSRGSDGVLGVGWSLAVPDIRIVLDGDRRKAQRGVFDDAETRGDKIFVADRWESTQAGPLLCSLDDGDLLSLNGLGCHSNPHGPMRFRPQGATYAESWIAQDPYEGVTQRFGEDDASRILNADGQPIAWLLSRETTEFGKELRYFYEERRGSEQRVLRAILMAGDRVIRFNYEPRLHNITKSFATGTERKLEWLLTEIQLVAGCVPEQVIDAPNDVWTDLNSCDDVPVVERIAIGYANPQNRFSGHYVLSSWQHMSGDKSVSYSSVRFSYDGDGLVTRSTGTDVLTRAETPDFEVPDGYGLISNSAYGPMQNLVDWNRDGLADWVSMKRDLDRYWPDPNSEGQFFYVQTRNETGYGPRAAYRDPLTYHAAWLDTRENGQHLLWREYIDSITADTQAIGDLSIGDAMEQIWPNAVIGLETDAWIRDLPEDDEKKAPSLPDPSKLRALSMTVPCDDLDERICEAITDSYNSIWSETLGELSDVDALGVKLTDLADMNGDGYLDRLVSGLIVNWDPAAPDADDFGRRDPVDGDPAIYVAYFNPQASQFHPFKRYNINRGGANFNRLSTAFLSALAVNVSFNGKTSPADMSYQSAPRAIATGIGVAAQAYGLSKTFAPDHAATYAPTDGGNATGQQLTQLSAATGAYLTAASLIARASDAPPETLAAIGHAQLIHSGISSTKSAVEAANVIATASDAASQAAGWAQFSSSIVGVAAKTINAVWQANTKAQLRKGGYNALALTSKTKTATGIISFVAASVSLVATLVIAATASAATANPFGWFVSTVLAVLALAFSLDKLFSADDVWETGNGLIKVEYKTQRGVVYRANSSVRGVSSQVDLLDWIDMNGDFRPDLIIGGFDPQRADFAVAVGDTSDVLPGTAPNPATKRLRAWEFGEGAGASVPVGIRQSDIDTRYAIRDSQRGDLIKANQSLIDMNGDGLVDRVSAMESTTDGNGNHRGGYHVAFNNGLGFEFRRAFLVPQQFLPSGLEVEPKLSRSRALFWTEFAGKQRGFSVGLNNLVQTLGPDLDNNGLPDIVVKDEGTYSELLAAGPCADWYAIPTVSMVALPVDPEPEPTNGCTDGHNAWFTRFDGLLASEPLYGEGRTHLTPAAHQVFAPSHRARHYVAFNTGEGFTDFVAIEGRLPSFGGSMSVISVVPEADGTPNMSMNGTTNALIDHSASGALRLIAMDTEDGAIWQLDGPHPVASQTRIGRPNTDALTRIHYPDGGQVFFDYTLKKDINGPQGPPLWVLDRATFDDKVRQPLAALQGWTSTQPFVEYEYEGASWFGREFLGFESILENRFNGETRAQIIQSYYQSGAERLMPRCTEIRSQRVDNFTTMPGSTQPETFICVATEDQTDSIGVAFPTTQTPAPPVVQSCSANINAAFGSNLLPLLQRVENTYSTTHSLDPSPVEASELRRVATLERITTTTFNGATSGASHTVNVNYGVFPYLVPTVSLATTSDGLSRSEISEWTVRTTGGDWLFHKTASQRFDSLGNETLRFEYDRTSSAPYQLRAQHEIASDGTRRTIEYGDWNAGGQPRRITVNGLVKTYTYAGDFENGTGAMRSVSTLPGPGQTNGGTEGYSYNVMGRVTSHENVYGGVTEHAYDGLGFKLSETLPKRGSRTFRYREIGKINVGRSDVELSESQRTSFTEEVDGQFILTDTYWDGFGRAFRRAQSLEGGQFIEMDFNGDGVVDVENRLRYGNDWFDKASANLLIVDMYLSASGQMQCQSQNYFDGTSPASFSTALHDGLGRLAFSRDIMGFGATTRHGYDAQTDQRWIETQDGASSSARNYLDGLDRVVRSQANNQREQSARFSDWDHLLERTDALGFVSRWERNAWGAPVRECYQVTPGAVPSDLSCPANWPTTVLQYNDYGQLIRRTEPNGAVMDVVPSSCGMPREVIGHSLSSSDEDLRPVLKTEFDAACNPILIEEEEGVTTQLDYDDAGRLQTRVDLADKVERKVVHGYDARGRRQWTQGADGLRRYMLYDFRDDPVEQWLDKDTRHAFFRDIRGQVVLEQRPSGRQVRHSFDWMGRRLRTDRDVEICDLTALNSGTFATQSATASRRFEYDRKGQLVAATDPMGARHSFEWDVFSFVRSMYAPSATIPNQSEPNSAMHFTRDAKGNLIAIESPATGKRTEYEYDGRGLEIEKREIAPSSLVRQTVIQRNAIGQAISVTPPHDLSERSCLIPGTESEDVTVMTSFNPAGLPETHASAVDQSGQRLELQREYGLNALPKSFASSDGASSEMEYSGFHDLTRLTDQWGRTWAWDFDDIGRLQQTLDPAKNPISYDYDTLGQLTSLTNGRGITQSWTYNRDGQRTSSGQETGSGSAWVGETVRRNIGGQTIARSVASYVGSQPPDAGSWVPEQITRMCYDLAGRVQAQIDQIGRITQYRYNLRGERVSTWRQGQGNSWTRTRNEYDDAGRLVGQSRPLTGSASSTTRRGYNAFGQLVSESNSAIQSSRSFEYDAGGLLCAIIDNDASGELRRQSFQYNARGRMVSSKISSRVGRERVFDAYGALVRAEDPAGSWSFERSAEGRLETLDQIVPSLGGGFRTKYQYDDAGRLEAVVLPQLLPGTDAPTLRFERLGSSGLVDGVSWDGDDIYSVQGFDGAGRRLNWSLGPIRKSARFDSAGQLESLEAAGPNSVIQHLEFQRDTSGAITGITDFVDPVFSSSLQLDRQERILREAQGAVGGNRVYRWSQADILRRERGANQGDLRHLLTPGGALDAIRRGQSNRSMSQDRFGNRNSDALSRAEMQFDDHNRLTKLTDSGGAGPQMVYDFKGRRVVAGDVIYLYGTGRHPIAELQLDQRGRIIDAHYTLYIQGELVARINARTGERRFFVIDHRRSPIAELDENGDLLAERAYDAFGDQLLRDARVKGAFSTQVGFMGSYQLAPKLPYYLMGHRVYDAETARFLSADPLGVLSEDSLYGFARGNPHKYADPMGLSAVLHCPDAVSCEEMLSGNGLSEDGTIILDDLDEPLELELLGDPEEYLRPTRTEEDPFARTFTDKSSALTQGMGEVYSEKISWETATNLGYGLMMTATADTNSLGNVVQGLDALALSPFVSYEGAPTVSDAVWHFTLAASQVPADVVYLMIEGGKSPFIGLGHLGKHVGTTVATPYVYMFGTDQQMYELGRMRAQAEFGMFSAGVDALLTVGAARFIKGKKPTVAANKNAPPIAAPRGSGYITLYHGVQAGDVDGFVAALRRGDDFRMNYQSSRHDFRDGVYLAEDRLVAQRYAGEGGVVFEVRIPRPHPDDIVDIALQSLDDVNLPGAQRAEFVEIMQGPWEWRTGNPAQDAANARGFTNSLTPEFDELFGHNVVRGQLFSGNAPPNSPYAAAGLGFEYNHVQWRFETLTPELREGFLRHVDGP